ncbi:hypothetical protein E4U25_005481 [Claviceps purpurea]|nr:hypothetical protein E4U25_005481 [Claviceps purpurea]
MAGITYWEVGQSRKLNKDIHNSTGPRFGALPNAATSTLIGPLVSLAPQFTLLLKPLIWRSSGPVSARCSCGTLSDATLCNGPRDMFDASVPAQKGQLIAGWNSLKSAMGAQLSSNFNWLLGGAIRHRLTKLQIHQRPTATVQIWG